MTKPQPLSAEVLLHSQPPEGLGPALTSARAFFEKHGFRIVAEGRRTLSLQAPQELYERILGLQATAPAPTKTRVKDFGPLGPQPPTGGLSVPGELRDLIESIDLQTPPLLLR